MNRVSRDTKAASVEVDEMTWALAGMTARDWADVSSEKGETGKRGIKVPPQTFPAQIREVMRTKKEGGK